MMRKETRNEDDQLHSFNDEPAVEYTNGTKHWYQNGELHRLNGPAVIYPSGIQEWYQNGKQHRLDGPAVEYFDGDKHWYQNGKLHRDDGPAIERAGGIKAWYQNGERHRLNGPAIEFSNGDKYWYQNGLKHRVGGPAIEPFRGNKAWYQHGKPHRLDGPAVEFTDGTKKYYIEGEELSEEEFLARVWHQDGLGHRVSSSAVSYQNGQLYRLDGSSVEHTDRIKYRYSNEELHRLGVRNLHIEEKQRSEEDSLVTSRNKKAEEYLKFKKSRTLEEIIDDELVNCHLGTYESFDSPYDAVVALMMFHQDLGAYFGNSQSEKVNEPDDYRYIVKNKNEDNYRLFLDKPHVHTSYSWELFGAEDNYEEKGTSITKEQAMVLLNLDDEKHLPSWETASMGVFPVWNYSDY